MNKNYLFSPIYRKIGWSLFIPFAILGILMLFGIMPEDLLTSKTLALVYSGFGENCQFFSMVRNDSWYDEFIIIVLFLSLLFIAFSREKDEDECISSIRAESLIWAIKMNTIILIVGTLFIFGVSYLLFAYIYMYTMFILFIIKYHIQLNKFRKNTNEE